MFNNLSQTQRDFRQAFLHYLVESNNKTEKQLYTSILALWSDARVQAKEDKKAVGSDEIINKVTPLTEAALEGLQVSQATRTTIDSLIDTFIQVDKKRELCNLPGGHVLPIVLDFFPKNNCISEPYETCLHAIYDVEVDGHTLVKRGHAKESEAAFEIANNLKRSADSISIREDVDLQQIAQDCTEKARNSNLTKHRGPKQKLYNALMLLSFFGIFYRAIFCNNFWLHTRPKSVRHIHDAVNHMTQFKTSLTV